MRGLTPVVAIHVSPDAPAGLVQAAVTACSKGAGACREGTPGEGETGAELVWSAGGLAVEISVASPAGRRSRSLRFRAEDPEIERWRAAGFAVAVLADVEDAKAVPPPAASSAAPPASSAPPPPPPPSSATTAPPLPPPPVEARRLGVGAGAVLTTGLGGRARVGGEARMSFGSGTAALGATLPHEHLGVEEELLWISAGVLSRPMAAGPLAVRARAELFLERFEAELYESTGHDGRDRFLPGARAGVDGGWSLGRRVLVGGTVELGARFGSTTVFRRGERVDTLPVLRPAAAGWALLWL